MSYREIDEELLLAYADGVLNDQQRTQVEALLEEMPELRSELDALWRTERGLRATLKSVDLLPPPGAATWQSIARRTTRRGRPVRRWQIGALSAAICSAVVVIGLFGLMLNSRRTSLSADRLLAPSVTSPATTPAITITPTVIQATHKPRPDIIRIRPGERWFGPTFIDAAPTSRPAPADQRQAELVLKSFVDAYNRHNLADVFKLFAQIDYKDCASGDGHINHLQDQAALEQWLHARFTKREQLEAHEYYIRASTPVGSDEPIKATAVVVRLIAGTPPEERTRRARIDFVLTGDGERINSVEFTCTEDAAAVRSPVFDQVGVVGKAFLDAYHRGDVDGVLQTLTEIDYSDCDGERKVNRMQDRPALEEWLRKRFAQHDQFDIKRTRITVPAPQLGEPVSETVTALRTNDLVQAEEIRIGLVYSKALDGIDKVTFYCNPQRTRVQP